MKQRRNSDAASNAKKNREKKQILDDFKEKVTFKADLKTTMSPAGCNQGSPSTCTGISVLVFILMWLPCK